VPDGVKLQILRTTDDLYDFVPEWDSLWGQDANATPFQSPAWLMPWWQQFGSEDLRAVVLRRSEKCVGFLPAYVYRDPAGGERKLMLLGVGTTDYLDGVFAPECSVEDLKCALNAVLEMEGWDCASFPQVRSGTKLAMALCQCNDYAVRSTETAFCSRIDAVELEALPQKIRRNAMYYRNRAQRGGALNLEVADDSACAVAFEELVLLHTARWRERGESGVLADPRVLAWHRTAVPVLQQQGLLRLYRLRWRDETLAVLYSLVDPPQRVQRTQYFYLTAYSIIHAELRPGTLLHALTIHHAAHAAISHIDMLRGEEEYKALWHPERVPTLGFHLRAAAQEGRAAA
jgi:CelD/BcsL family acetyltransferase involved in cellulose biosynthesis